MKSAGGGFDITLSNIGHSPALNVFTHTHLIASPAQPNEFTEARYKNAFSEAQQACSVAGQESATGEVRTTLFPEEHTTERRYSNVWVEDISRYVLEYTGCVTYTFPFKQELHQTGFWGIIAIPSTKQQNTFLVPGPDTGIMPIQRLRIIDYRVFAN